MPPPPLSGAAAAGAPGGGTDDPSQENPVVALLCYLLLWIGGVIVLATDMKKSRYMRFHAWHGIFISIAWAVVLVAVFILQAVLGVMHLGFVSVIMGLLLPCVGIALLVLVIIMGIKAYNKQDVFTIPVVTDMARQQADKMRV